MTKHKLIVNFRLRQITNSDLAEPCKSAFALTVIRTKMFHVKQFCRLDPEIGQNRDFGDIDIIGGYD